MINEFYANQLFPLIQEVEGLRLEAYKDGNTRYSIGYGTISFAGEKITEAEAKNRSITYLIKMFKDLNLPITSNPNFILIGCYSYQYGTGAGLKIKNKSTEELIKFLSSLPYKSRYEKTIKYFETKTKIFFLGYLIAILIFIKMLK